MKTPEAQLDKKLTDRMHQWFKRGFLAEVKRLKADGLSDNRMNELGFEYRAVNGYLEGLLTKEQMYDEIIRGLKKYIKRQMRWFGREKAIAWMTAKDKRKIQTSVREYLEN